MIRPAGLVAALWVAAARPAGPAPPFPRLQDRSCPTPPALSVDSLLALGRYWHAARAAGALGTRPPPAESALVHARIAEGLQRYARVEALLRRVPGADSLPLALALGARADERAERWAAAAVKYRRLLALSTADPEVQAWAAARLPFALEHSASRDSATAAWRRAALAVPELADWFALRRAALEPDTAVAFAVVGGGRTPGARLRAEQFVVQRRLRAGNAAGAAKLARRHGCTLELARVEFALGRWRDARLIADSILFTETIRPSGFLAATFLTERFDALTLREALGVSRAYRARNDLVAAERIALRALQRADTSVAAWLEVARLQAEQRQVALALRTVDSAGARAGRRRGTLIAAARVRVLLIGGRLGEVDTLVRQLIRAHRGDTGIARVVLERADLHRARGEGADERTLYGALVRRFPGAPATTVARFRYGLQLYAAGQPDSAWAYVTAAARDDSLGELGLGPQYWRGRLAMERGDSTAPTDLRRLARTFPVHYYGVRARELLGDSALVADRPLPRPRFGSFPPARARTRLRLLAALGYDREVRDEALGWLGDTTVSVQVLLAAAQVAADAGYARESIALGEAAKARVGMTTGVARAIFPLPWRTVIESEAEEQCVDPFLLAALIRQESRFDVRAVSRAGARGMSQVMPATGAQMSERLRLGAWDAELLFVPDFNLHLGTRYLYERQARDTFPPLPLLASYNAGPARVGRWRTWPEFGDPDLFAERVSIPETRDYVRTVYASYVWYRSAWLPPPPPPATPPSAPLP